MDIAKINKAMNYLATHTVEIGILGSGGNLGGEEEVTVLKYGTVLEFGSNDGRIAPFGYFRRAINTNKDKISLKVKELVNDILRGELNGRFALMQLGEFLRGLIIESIATAGEWGREYKNPKYLEWKAKKYPNRMGQKLILDGFLIKSIRYKILKFGVPVYLSDFGK
ncbi:hypothetical protein SAMN02745174_02438 [Cetobacterium ceti]|uniref:Uncharacterized protein n=1 Tax=Cetobacterium ceti TaxID=180163 RepID=A0A1T4QSM5_9FUSO|nr:hypothetical protein [Cetobacterium ceti]SKA06783.1 hypothetical protein SAMN02745174_02438 [Cetobacterium ceti]